MHRNISPLPALLYALPHCHEITILFAILTEVQITSVRVENTHVNSSALDNESRCNGGSIIHWLSLSRESLAYLGTCAHCFKQHVWWRYLMDNVYMNLKHRIALHTMPILESIILRKYDMFIACSFAHQEITAWKTHYLIFLPWKKK